MYFFTVEKHTYPVSINVFMKKLGLISLIEYENVVLNNLSNIKLQRK